MDKWTSVSYLALVVNSLTCTESNNVDWQMAPDHRYTNIENNRRIAKVSQLSRYPAIGGSQHGRYSVYYCN